MISIQHLSKKYKGCTALDDCTIEFENTGLVAITGVSGSGKTTLLNIIGMLDAPTSGEILFDGKSLTSDAEKTLYRQTNIGYVFQDAIMLEQLSVKENIVLPTNVAGVELDEIYFKKIITGLDIEPLLDRKINELSAGQKQRIAIARSLICKPTILLADEPTGNLDEKTSNDVFNILKSISEDILVIVVTHNEAMATRFATRIVELKYGKIVYDDANENTQKSLPISSMSSAQNKSKKQRSFYLAWANFNVKKKKMTKIILVAVLTLLISALGLAFVEVSNENSTNVEKYFLDTNLLIVKEDLQNNITAFLSSKYSTDKFLSDYTFLKDDKRVEEISENYQLVGINVSGDIQIPFKDISTIKIDNYFKQRLLSSKINGDFLSDDFDIILSSSTAKSIFPSLSPDDCIGKEVTISGNYYSERFRIVGINNSKDINGKIVSYITVHAAKRINEVELQKEPSVELYSDKSYSINKTTEGNEIVVKDSGKAILLREEDLSNYKLVCGKSSLSDGEMLISTGVLNDFSFLFGNENSYKYGISFEQLKAISSIKILCVANNSSYFNVVGVYEDDENGLSVIVNDSDYANLLKVLPTSINAYVTNVEDIADVTATIESQGLTATSPYSYFKDAVGNRMSSITYIFSFLVLLMVLITILIINTFSKHNILDSIHDIGLLKAIGANKNYILKIYVAESVITGAMSSLIAVFIYPSLIWIFNYLFEKGYINIMTSPLSISVLHLVFITVSGVFLFVLSSLPSILRISKTDAIVAIRKIG